MFDFGVCPSSNVSFSSRWLGYRIDMMAWAFLVVVVFAALGIRDSMKPGLLGLTLL